jgi:hypothetical protein
LTFHACGSIFPPDSQAGGKTPREWRERAAPMPTGNSENDVVRPVPEVDAPVLGAGNAKPEPSQPDLAYRLAKALLEGEPSGSESTLSAGLAPGVPPVGSSACTERKALTPEQVEVAVEAMREGTFPWCRARLMHALAGAALDGILREVLDELLERDEIQLEWLIDGDPASKVNGWLIDSLREAGWFDGKRTE